MIKSKTVKIRGQQSFRKFKDKSKPSANKFINKKDTMSYLLKCGLIFHTKGLVVTFLRFLGLGS